MLLTFEHLYFTRGSQSRIYALHALPPAEDILVPAQCPHPRSFCALSSRRSTDNTFQAIETIRYQKYPSTSAFPILLVYNRVLVVSTWEGADNLLSIWSYRYPPQVSTTSAAALTSVLIIILTFALDTCLCNSSSFIRCKLRNFSLQSCLRYTDSTVISPS